MPGCIMHTRHRSPVFERPVAIGHGETSIEVNSHGRASVPHSYQGLVAKEITRATECEFPACAAAAAIPSGMPATVSALATSPMPLTVN